MERGPQRIIRQNWQDRARGDDAPDKNTLITVNDLTAYAMALLHTYRDNDTQNSMSLNEAVSVARNGLNG